MFSPLTAVTLSHNLNLRVRRSVCSPVTNAFSKTNASLFVATAEETFEDIGLAKMNQTKSIPIFRPNPKLLLGQKFAGPDDYYYYDGECSHKH